MSKIEDVATAIFAAADAEGPIDDRHPAASADRAYWLGLARAAIDAGDQWRPIAISPRDGTRFLVFRRIADDFRIEMVWWQGNILGGESFWYSDAYMPSHWRPMPTLPE